MHCAKEIVGIGKKGTRTIISIYYNSNSNSNKYSNNNNNYNSSSNSHKMQQEERAESGQEGWQSHLQKVWAGLGLPWVHVWDALSLEEKT